MAALILHRRHLAQRSKGWSARLAGAYASLWCRNSGAWQRSFFTVVTWQHAGGWVSKAHGACSSSDTGAMPRGRAHFCTAITWRRLGGLVSWARGRLGNHFRYRMIAVWPC